MLLYFYCNIVTELIESANETLLVKIISMKHHIAVYRNIIFFSVRYDTDDGLES